MYSLVTIKRNQIRELNCLFAGAHGCTRILPCQENPNTALLDVEPSTYPEKNLASLFLSRTMFLRVSLLPSASLKILQRKEIANIAKHRSGRRVAARKIVRRTV